MPICQAFDRLDLVTVSLDRQYQARADQTTVERHAASAAVSRTAPLLAAGELELVSEHVEQSELRVAQKLGRLAIDDGRYVMFAH
jgi:hypothetical protein